MMRAEAASLTGVLDEVAVVLPFHGEGERERAALRSMSDGGSGRRRGQRWEKVREEERAVGRGLSHCGIRVWAG
jgi:hypothetical protein